MLPTDKSATALSDNARVAIEKHLYEKHLSMAKGSAMLGKNPSYLHQFLKGGTPKRLPFEMAELVHRVFGLPVETLLNDGSAPAAPKHLLLTGPAHQSPRTAPRSDVYAPDVSGAPAFIPAFADNGGTTRGAERSYTEAPPAAHGEQAFAVWISEPAGRLRPGDLAYVSRVTPARPGDIVLVLLGDDIAGLGELTGITGTEITLATGQESLSLPRPAHTALKVLGARFG